MNKLFLIFYLIKLTISLNLHFPHSLQRFVYDDLTNTIILASVNHIYSLNGSDLSILSDINISSTKTDQHCLITNKTSLTKNLYYFSTTSYLHPSINNTFNQLLLLVNNSVLICSTSNRGGSCQLRSLINLNLLKNSSQRIVSSSPFYPSIGFINKNHQILYISNTYDSICDPFYEIPTISTRYLIDKEFLSIINFNSGLSALQQSTSVLRLLNTRLIKDFFLYYLYGFEYKNFSYFLTIQQSDIHHLRKYKLQTKIIRFCQTLKQSIIKSYIEIPLTCGTTYQYLITAKFSHEKNILYGLFRNTTLANLTSTSHALCAYSIDTIQEGFFQTIKRCIVDGKGHRGLGFISPDTHCVSNKNLNDIDPDYCPDENDDFFQYPIGGHRSIEQPQPIIEFHDKVNFTSIEIGFNEKNTIICVGDDNGTVHTFDTSNPNEIFKQNFQSNIIIDLKLINQIPSLKKAQLIILADNQIIKQNLSTCEQYTTCNECSNAILCRWCYKQNKCTPMFECVDENKRNHGINKCMSIERVIPQIISVDSLNTELQIVLDIPLGNKTNEYMCRFSFEDKDELYHTNAVLHDNTVKCLPPVLQNRNQAVNNVILSIYHLKTNLIYGYYKLIYLNCSNFLSCSSCTSYSNVCQWNHESANCKEEKSSLTNYNQCSFMYLQPSIDHLAYNITKTLIIHIEECNQSLDINSCELYDHRKRVLLIESNPELIRSDKENNLCLLKCSFQWLNIPQISFHRSLKLHLSIQFSNQTKTVIPHTHISLYDCQHMALNCTSCLQLNPSYGCIWCNNMCMFKNQTVKCLDNQKCLVPIIQMIEPLILPTHGGTLVTIKGRYFDLFDLSISIADVPCQLIEEESSREKIVCQSGNAGLTYRSGFVQLKFGFSGPKINSHQKISYINPKIKSIEPLIGIQNGGTVLTIRGENFTIGNSHISVLIGNRPCQLLSISSIKIECETRAFPSSMLNEKQPIKVSFDRYTKLTFEQYFTVVSNPILYSFDKYHPFQSFTSGGHQLIILGENLNTIQNIQLEFHHFIYLSPLLHNNTHLVFLTPSIEELHLNNQRYITITIYLDNFNQTSSLIYVNDPIIYPLEPVLQTYSPQLNIQGKNLTSIGHTKNDIIVHIGCNLCTINHLQSDQIICQPPLFLPKKYSKTKQLCYNSEHPSIIVSIDNIHSHVGFMVYPKKIIILGIISGCLFTILLIVLIILLIICLKIRHTKRKYFQRYLYMNSIKPEEKYSPSITLPIRSYLNYLQVCYYSEYSISDKIKSNLQQEIIDQFKYLISNHDELIEYLFKHSIKLNNKNILNKLILTQRYNFKKLFQFNHDLIHFNICILTSYDAFLINHIHSLFSQIYSQLKFQIHNGPIDAIEQTISYYSLNMNTILHDQSIGFKTIQLIVHIVLNNHNSNDLVLNITCLTCDTISQVKQKILAQLNHNSNNECKLYLLTNHPCSSSSSSSSSSTASSSVPLIRKSLLTQVVFNRTLKYSTTAINDSYHDPNFLLLNDIDHTNEQVNNWKKLNTLQHYGIITDGYELKMIVFNKQNNYTNTLRSSCHYCSVSTSTNKLIFNYLISPLSLNEHDRSRYIHLLNHTYEEIGSELSHLLMANNPNETYRLFETKSIIHSTLINLIEVLFTNLIHSDTYLSELIEQYSQFFHLFYAHFIPFIFRNMNCLFDISIDKSLNSSLDILAMIFQLACCQQNERECSSCIELLNNENSNSIIQNCTFLFGDEIQRVRLYYTNLERCLHNKNLLSQYSSTNTGIDKKFELDNSIFENLIEYSCLHADEIIEHLNNQSRDNNILPIFLNLVQMYRSTERT